jgi:hypothetical protein
MASSNLLAIAVTVDDGQPFLHYAAFHDEASAREWLAARREDSQRMKLQSFTEKVLDLDQLKPGAECL